MSASVFQIIAPDADQHLLPVGQLTADVFSGGKYVEAFCQNYIGNSHYDWNVSRIVLDGEKIIHHWGVWGYLMWVETVQLRVAGIGAVATHPDYRKLGVMHQAAQSSFSAMENAGYDLSILRGRHYVKMGYARAWNYVTYRLKFAELPELEPEKPYQKLKPEQVSEMDAFYNQTHVHFTGTAIRPTFRNRHPDDIGTYAWFNTDGKMEGYIRALPDEDNPKIFLCLEAAGDPHQGLAVFRDLYKQGEYESANFFTLPHHHPIPQVLRRGACIVEDRYFDISGWRVRIVNLNSTLTKLTPLFEKRLAESVFAGWQGSLLLDAGEQKAILYIEQGKVEVKGEVTTEHILRGGADIARFLIGSDEPDEIIRQAGMTYSGQALQLARVLFPNLHPMMSHWDEY